MEGLSRHAEVTLASFGSGPPLPFEGVRVASVARGVPSTLRANLRAGDLRLPLQVRLFLDARMRALVEEELERSPPAVVHATLARMAPYLPPDGRCHRHLDLVDALSLNMATRSGASRGPARLVFSAEARLLRRFEARSARAADSCSLVSEWDLRAAPGLREAAVIPNGVDLEAFPFADPSERPPVLLFFGNLGYFHNVEPARFVATEVLPRVRREVPEATLRLAGARPAPAVRALARLEGVEVVGEVDRMADELHRAAVAVVPMFSGSGMKNKVLEGFCAGTPVVTNALGIQGLSAARAGRDYLEEEIPAGLAAACTRLLKHAEERRRLAAAALQLVKRNFTWDIQVERLLGLYGLDEARQGARGRK